LDFEAGHRTDAFPKTQANHNTARPYPIRSRFSRGPRARLSLCDTEIMAGVADPKSVKVNVTTGAGMDIEWTSCGTPVLARCAMTSEARQAVSPANRQEPSPESYPCSNRQPSRFRRRAWASTRSDSNGTMGTNWEFIRGSFCGMFARARSAGRCEQRRWDKVILCANSEILQEHIPGATSA